MTSAFLSSMIDSSAFLGEHSKLISAECVVIGKWHFYLNIFRMLYRALILNNYIVISHYIYIYIYHMLLSTWIAPSWCLFMTSYYPISSKGSLHRICWFLCIRLLCTNLKWQAQEPLESCASLVLIWSFLRFWIFICWKNKRIICFYSSIEQKPNPYKSSMPKI